MHTLIIILAVIALLLVIFEDLIHINKAKSTLYIGTFCWLLAYVTGLDGLHSKEITHRLNENLLEIATLWLFLMSAMTFVAYLNSKHFISIIAHRLLPPTMSERYLMLFIGAFAFIFSSLADNVTATLVALAIITSIDISPHKRLKYAALVVFAVNSGGVSLITGDVTTLMIFLAGKVSIPHLLLLILPALCGVIFLAFAFSFQLNGQVSFTPIEAKIRTRDKVIACIFISTIILTLALNILYQVPPVLTFLFGLSCMFIASDFLPKEQNEASILHYIREIEYDTLLFFLGILLIVGILKEINVLNQITLLYEHMPVQVANYFLGIASALIDNVPLTAALLKSDIQMQAADWLAVTYATGVGGSLLIIGSAAGIIAMSKVKEVTFINYLTLFFYLLIAYTIGYSMSFMVSQWAL